MSNDKSDKQLRSQAWFGRQDKMGFYYRSFLKNSGTPQDRFEGRPVIGICNTWSELTPCNAHFRVIAEHVRQGVLDAGGYPLEFPVSSLGEVTMRPTAMLFRNLASMDVEEAIRAHPLDGVVLLMGCDKTTPALLMGAASADLPAIGVSGGPQLRGVYRGQIIGSGTNIISMSEQLRAGEITLKEFHEAEAGMNRSAGSCMTMGTASTMASMVEALGIGLPENAAIPAADARRNLLARMAGRRIVEMVGEDLKPSDILTRQAFENAIRTLAAIGGSTNAVVHLLAIAGRVGVELTLDDFDRLCRDVHCLVDLMPSGRFLMEDFYYAGGLPAVLRALGERGLLHKDARTVNGKTLWDNVADAPNYNAEVITPFETPFKSEAGIAILTGNLAPNGAVIKPSAASPELMNHTGRAVVFESVEEMHDAVDDDTLDIDASCIMVLKNCGPKGYPGMAEVGNMPLPAKLLREGVRDMIRISDARMSGTAYGTVVLHVAPEATVGGPLALVKNGDMITLDVAARRLHLHVSDEELATRRAAWTPPKPHASRGYQKLYIDHVLQADRGVDFDFLVGRTGSPVPRDNH
ncbi:MULTISPECIES: IlvD/Edd family dehydratase [Bradyrhizobium]|jgi:L-arabonate dehydrase|uniref:Dihydroxy-acid dehydratase n=2 Tax=Bradyrhizobium TaxID=374 RepID=A0ABS5G3F3_9BRAD|nr:MULTISPECIES: IlvD/Edd family dehydratase [Bradyrhizobium]RTM06021.1 MAG: dihydroxy-acid dehydratase [Bradyrhizobiaceae bacterium]MBR1135609.1 dihydroxy-acid dehydratase [Bradyrhizobium denitrificans]MCL8482614.1 dihydroxy-acid dehydratase [Bradyrhizobium denitrificans]MDU1494794.1 IlvD/Edd family dehydratase [Bradyrhizobium sp.]MDU1544915.1 IlvD/Edd family dehydratase [Bradyrhizobium sp.]